jgi:hypothetical protein
MWSPRTALQNIELEMHTTPDDIPEPADLYKNIKHVIVFDDIDRNQEPAAKYFTKSRSANCNRIYLSQNYTHLPLHTIRTNTNFMLFFKFSPMVAEQLFINLASVDVTLKEFK